jgi:putative nucleotidyltransferase with HDIG domain
LNALHTIDTTISAKLDLQLLFGLLLTQANDLLGVDAASILLLDPQAHRLEFASGRGFRSQRIQSTSISIIEGQSGQVALKRQRVFVPDLSATDEEQIRPELKEEGFVAYCGAPLNAKGEVKGVLEVFHRSPLRPDREWLDFLDTLAGRAALAIENAAMFDDLQRSNQELNQAYDATLQGWARALDLRDRDTEDHTQRVTEMTLRLAQAMGIRDEELVQVRYGALLHDIGKMGIPDSILLKNGPLTDDEWQVMRRHPSYAREMLAPIAFLQNALDIPYCHHEWWDGSGYPRALKGEQIPVAARIFAVVDVWDALISDRPYRAAWPEKKVFDYIQSLNGRQFDPRVVEVFFRVFRQRKG